MFKAIGVPVGYPSENKELLSTRAFCVVGICPQ